MMLEPLRPAKGQGTPHVVVAAGMVGLARARHLQKRGVEVTGVTPPELLPFDPTR